MRILNKKIFENGLFNYFTKRSLIIKIMGLIFAILLIIYFAKYSYGVFNDQNLYYYVFSTIVQGYLALVSFLGAVVIYKLQISENSLDTTNERLKNTAKQFKGAIAESLSVDEMMKLGKQLSTRETKDKDFYESMVEKGCGEMEKIIQEKREIRSKMVDFSFLSFINVGMSLVGIPISKLFIVSNLYKYSETYLFINIILSFITMVYAFLVIRKTLGYDFKI